MLSDSWRRLRSLRAFSYTTARRTLRRSQRITSLTPVSWLQALKGSTWTTKLSASRSLLWLEEKFTLRPQPKSIRWSQWMTRIQQLTITTRDGCGFSSPGAQLMFTLIFLTSWSCSRVEAAKVEIQAFTSLRPRRMSLPKLLFRFFMLLSRDRRRPIQTVISLWISLRLPVLSMPHWGGSLWLGKSKAKEQTNKRVDFSPQSSLKAPRTAIRQQWLMEMSMVGHILSLRPW